MSKRLQVTLKDEMSEKLDELAKYLGVSKSAVIALALQDFDKNIKIKKKIKTCKKILPCGYGSINLYSEVIISW
ncbi:CopG family transcriptional regulator [Staphylococcus haemolyticus]|nr:CopG family transcriptional regulator [Staphylococcus haemolyticus]